MSQTFRKYLNNRGSALFMVLSTMSALFMLVTAMYFSVVSSRSVQYAVFNQEQSYQSSISISDALVSSLRSGKAPSLSNEILKLAPPATGAKTGGVLSTNGNGFAEFLGEASGTYSSDQLGAYTVDITRLSDATENGTNYQVYDFAITTSVGGVLETTHTFVRYSGEFKDPPDIFGTGMTSTGYVPNSPRLDRGTYDTPLRYDSEYCVIGDGASDFNGTYPQINNDLTCTGTLRLVLSNIAPNSSVPLTWVIGNDLELDSYNNSLSIDLKGTAATHGKLIIGGDLIASDVSTNNSFCIAANTDVFVQGDVYIKNGIQIGSGGRLFVKGNIYLTDPTVYSWGVPSLNGWTVDSSCFFVGGSIWDTTSNVSAAASYYIGGVLLSNKMGVLDTTKADWTDAMEIWDGKMTSPTYEKWSVLGDGTGISHATLLFNNDYRDLDYKGKLVKGTTLTNYDLSIDKYPDGVIIDDIIDVSEYYHDVLGMEEYSPNQKNIYGIVIDTGEDPDAIFKIQITPNHDYDSENGNETFTWLPLKDAAYKSDGSKKPYVLIKGRGTLAIEVPEGTTYQAAHQEAFMHMNWYTMLGGTIQYAANGNSFVNALDTVNCSGTALNNGWIHTTDKCSGSVVCDIVQKTETDDKGESVQIHYCNTHERKVTLSEVTTNGCGCYGVVERSKVKSWVNSSLSSKTAEQQAAFYDSAGEIIYPNVNTMLISSDESAQIRLSYFEDGVAVAQNTFWGWIYAPYMTYMAKPGGTGGSGGTRIVGGIIVSDYISDDWYTFTYCRPDESVYESMQNNLESTGTQIGHIWKAYGY